MMFSYNSDKFVICHNSGLESISKFFRLVINGLYIDGSVLVASLFEKTRLLLQEAKCCRRYLYFICHIFQSTSIFQVYQFQLVASVCSS